MIDPISIVDLRNVQRLSAMAVDVDSTIRRAMFMQRNVRYRNLLEYTAAAMLVVWAIVFVAQSESTYLIKLGVVLIGVSGVGVATVLRRRGSATNPPLSAPTGDLLRWHQAELLRQRDLLQRVPIWYLGPFVPGLALILGGHGWLTRIRPYASHSVQESSLQYSLPLPS